MTPLPTPALAPAPTSATNTLAPKLNSVAAGSYKPAPGRPHTPVTARRTAATSTSTAPTTPVATPAATGSRRTPASKGPLGVRDRIRQLEQRLEDGGSPASLPGYAWSPAGARAADSSRGRSYTKEAQSPRPASVAGFRSRPSAPRPRPTTPAPPSAPEWDPDDKTTWSTPMQEALALSFRSPRAGLSASRGSPGLALGLNLNGGPVSPTPSPGVSPFNSSFEPTHTTLGRGPLVASQSINGALAAAAAAADATGSSPVATVSGNPVTELEVELNTAERWLLEIEWLHRSRYLGFSPPASPTVAAVETHSRLGGIIPGTLAGKSSGAMGRKPGNGATSGTHGGLVASASTPNGTALSRLANRSPCPSPTLAHLQPGTLTPSSTGTSSGQDHAMTSTSHSAGDLHFLISTFLRRKLRLADRSGLLDDEACKRLLAALQRVNAVLSQVMAGLPRPGSQAYPATEVMAGKLVDIAACIGRYDEFLRNKMARCKSRDPTVSMTPTRSRSPLQRSEVRQGLDSLRPDTRLGYSRSEPRLDKFGRPGSRLDNNAKPESRLGSVLRTESSLSYLEPKAKSELDSWSDRRTGGAPNEDRSQGPRPESTSKETRASGQGHRSSLSLQNQRTNQRGHFRQSLSDGTGLVSSKSAGAQILANIRDRKDSTSCRTSKVVTPVIRNEPAMARNPEVRKDSARPVTSEDKPSPAPLLASATLPAASTPPAPAAPVPRASSVPPTHASLAARGAHSSRPKTPAVQHQHLHLRKKIRIGTEPEEEELAGQDAGVRAVKVTPTSPRPSRQVLISRQAPLPAATTPPITTSPLPRPIRRRVATPSRTQVDLPPSSPKPTTRQLSATPITRQLGAIPTASTTPNQAVLPPRPFIPEDMRARSSGVKAGAGSPSPPGLQAPPRPQRSPSRSIPPPKPAVTVEPSATTSNGPGTSGTPQSTTTNSGSTQSYTSSSSTTGTTHRKGHHRGIPVSTTARSPSPMPTDPSSTTLASTASTAATPAPAPLVESEYLPSLSFGGDLMFSEQLGGWFVPDGAL